MLKVGEVAPPLRAVTTGGATFDLAVDGGETATVVYFYPRAFTPNCTVETRRFAANYAEIVLAGAAIVGISTDGHDTQCRFAAELEVPFPLIADADKAIAKAYKVLRPVLRLAKRVTYVLAPDRTVLAAFHHEVLDVVRHRDDVLRFLHDRRG